MPIFANHAFRPSARACAMLAALTAFSARAAALEAAELSETYGALPFHFEENQGQTRDDVRFLSRGPGYGLYLTVGEAVLVLASPDREPAAHGRDAATLGKSAVIRMSLVGAAAQPRVTGRDELPGKAHYFIGSDPAEWHTNVPTYARVHYADVYRGIDLVYYGNQRQLEYDFVVAPGADPAQIILRFDGAESLEIDERGDLVLVADGGTIRHGRPSIYQKVDGVRRAVAGSYVLEGGNRVGFEVAAYDVGKPLIIDPVLLLYSTYLGGSGQDSGSGIALDSRGAAYVTGSTLSLDFPTTGGAFRPSAGGLTEAFVSKLDATGTALVYSTYLGGGSHDNASGIVVDGAGNAYVTGGTYSTDFPTTPGTSQPIHGGGPSDSFQASDAFVAKLDPTGSVLVYSTYVGGAAFDGAAAIAIDDWSNAYVTGQTWSSDFPTTAGALQPGLASGTCRPPWEPPTPCDAFVTKLNPEGSALVYSTYLGGTRVDAGAGIAVDAAGSAYVTGSTRSADFPTTPEAFQPAFRGDPDDYYRDARDAFVAKLDPSGSALVYATYLGGADDPSQPIPDRGDAIAVDFLGNAYVVGTTNSQVFPTTPGAFQTEGNPFAVLGPDLFATDVFVTKLDPTGSALAYSTYLGGLLLDSGRGIAVDTAGNAYVTGETSSEDFPTTPDAFQAALAGSSCGDPLRPCRYDAFVTKLNPAGSRLEYSTYLGGSGNDRGSGISVDSLGVGAVGNVYVTGYTGPGSTATDTNDFPTTPTAFQPVFNGGYSDAFVAKILGTGLPPLPVVTPPPPPPTPPLPLRVLPSPPLGGL